jgi:hypothetical protein
VSRSQCSPCGRRSDAKALLGSGQSPSFTGTPRDSVAVLQLDAKPKRAMPVLRFALVPGDAPGTKGSFVSCLGRDSSSRLGQERRGHCSG